MNFRHRTIQNAYYVADIDAAIDRYHRLWGLGPFLVRRHIALPSVTYRGQPVALDISAAYVQAGPIMVELVTQHDDSPSAFREMFAPGEEGFHHVAVIPDDYDRVLAEYASAGFTVVTELRTASGRGAAYVDARPMLGHFVEVYWPSEGLNALYCEVAERAERWDGRQLVIEVDPRA
jgi:catechol 2,3-dioxygenase-like lactoylglutathione lyase family enzyme